MLIVGQMVLYFSILQVSETVAADRGHSLGTHFTLVETRKVCLIWQNRSPVSEHQVSLYKIDMDEKVWWMNMMMVHVVNVLENVHG